MIDSQIFSDSIFTKILHNHKFNPEQAEKFTHNSLSLNYKLSGQVINKQFITKIFELDHQVLIPILEDNIRDLFFQLSRNKNQAANNFFAEQFFALPHHHLEHIFAAHENGMTAYSYTPKTSLFTILSQVDFDILEHNILQSREPFSGEGVQFNKFKLALEVFSYLIGNNGPSEQRVIDPQIFSDIIFTKILYNHKFRIEEVEKFINNLQKIDENIVQRLKHHFIECTKTHYENMSLLKHISSNLFEDIEQHEQINPIIKNLLEKTYFNTFYKNKRVDVVSKLVPALKKIIDSNFTLSVILEKAAQDNGNIYLINSGTIPGGTAAGLTPYPDIHAAIANRPIENYLAILVHEATHKLIHNKFMNIYLPFKSDDIDNTEIIKGYINEAKYLNAQTWTKEMFRLYSEDNHAIELFAWFTGEMTESLLSSPKHITGIPKAFAEKLWNYLCKEICNIPGIIEGIKLAILGFIPYSEGPCDPVSIVIDYMGCNMNMPEYIYDRHAISYDSDRTTLLGEEDQKDAA